MVAILVLHVNKKSQLTYAISVPNVSYMSEDDGYSFLKNSGNGVGPQIVVHHGRLSGPADPQMGEERTRKGRKTKLAAFGLSPHIIAQGDPEYAVMLRQADKWRKLRMKELLQAHGHVGVGVGTLVASAALCQAASRYLFQRSAKGGAEGGTGACSEDLKLAAKLSTDGRQNDLAAWELCAKEGQVRRRLNQTTQLNPWEVSVSGDTLAKPGRKTALQRHVEAAGGIDVSLAGEEPDDA